MSTAQPTPSSSSVPVGRLLAGCLIAVLGLSVCGCGALGWLFSTGSLAPTARVFEEECTHRIYYTQHNGEFVDLAGDLFLDRLEDDVNGGSPFGNRQTFLRALHWFSPSELSLCMGDTDANMLAARPASFGRFIRLWFYWFVPSSEVVVVDGESFYRVDAALLGLVDGLIVAAADETLAQAAVRQLRNTDPLSQRTTALLDQARTHHFALDLKDPSRPFLTGGARAENSDRFTLRFLLSPSPDASRSPVDEARRMCDEFDELVNLAQGNCSFRRDGNGAILEAEITGIRDASRTFSRTQSQASP